MKQIIKHFLDPVEVNDLYKQINHLVDKNKALFEEVRALRLEKELHEQKLKTMIETLEWVKEHSDMTISLLVAGVLERLK